MCALVPLGSVPRGGFEPPSLPREGNMLDRATPPGPAMASRYGLNVIFRTEGNTLREDELL